MAKAKKLPTPDDIMKLEIARELGLDEKIRREGWKSLSAKESRRIGGIMTKKKRELKKKMQPLDN